MTLSQTGRAGLSLAAVILLLMLGLTGEAEAREGSPDPSADLAVVGGYLIDGNGGPPVENSVILVEGDRIVHVGTVDDTEIPDGAEVLDASGRTVMPGLMDAHVHLFIVGHGVYSEYFPRYHDEQDRMRELMAVSARQLLDAGVTSARDVAAGLDDSIWIRDEVAEGRLPGPRLFVTGPFLQHSTGPIQAFFRWTVDGADDARQKARRLIDRGVDALKVIQLRELSAAEREAIAEEAHAAGVPMVVHASFEEEQEMAAEMGAASMEHLGAGPQHTGEFTDASIRALAREGVFVVPTMVVSLIYDITVDFPARLDHPRLERDLPDDVYEDVRASLEHPERLGYFAAKRKVSHRYAETVRRLYEAGVPLGVGTDSGTPMNFHYEAMWQEMELMVEAGIPPMDVIQMATRDNARLFGAADELGTLEPGKLADLLVVEGNPLVRMSALKPTNIVHVVKGGEVHR